MREKKGLELFDNIAILNKFLYMSEENYIEYNNGITILKITMNEDYHYLANNRDYPDLKPYNFSDEISNVVLEYIIEELKEQKPQIKNLNFKNRWEEVTFITKNSLALNK